MLVYEYDENEGFRSYVDKYCKKRGITVDQALGHKIVEYVCLMYKYER